MSNIIQHVSDIILEDYKSWENENILIDCPTGSGKTFFVINILAKYAKENNKTILYLCNRLQLYDKVKKLIENNQITNVYLLTYQALQEQIRSDVEIPKFNYLIADEAHYFLSDSDFNWYTDLSYKFVKDYAECTKIYMSATSDSLYKVLLEDNVISENRCYRLHPNYNYIDKIFFYKRKTHIEIIKHLFNTTGDRILYFCSSNQKWLDTVHEFYDDVNRICSTYTKNEEMSKLNQPDCIEELSDELITFPKRLLVVTKAFDCGVDLKDRKIKHIVCDIFDVDTIIQCIGRKRSLDDEDTVNLYIRDYSSNELILNLNHKNDILEPMDLFQHDMNGFLEKFNRRDEHYYGFYTAWATDQLQHINTMKYQKIIYDISLLKQAIQKSYRRLFVNYMGEEILSKISEVSIASVVKKEKLLEFLEENKDKELSKSEKESLINIINLRDNQRRQLKTIGTLNAYLIECHIDYTILSRRKSDPKRTFYWIIR